MLHQHVVMIDRRFARRANDRQLSTGIATFSLRLLAILFFFLGVCLLRLDFLLTARHDLIVSKNLNLKVNWNVCYFFVMRWCVYNKFQIKNLHEAKTITSKPRFYWIINYYLSSSHIITSQIWWIPPSFRRWHTATDPSQQILFFSILILFDNMHIDIDVNFNFRKFVN